MSNKHYIIEGEYSNYHEERVIKYLSCPHNISICVGNDNMFNLCIQKGGFSSDKTDCHFFKCKEEAVATKDFLSMIVCDEYKAEFRVLSVEWKELDENSQ